MAWALDMEIPKQKVYYCNCILYTSRHMERTSFVFESIIGNTDMGSEYVKPLLGLRKKKTFLFHKYLYNFVSTEEYVLFMH